MVILPQFDQPLNTLTISFKYGRGNTSGGYSVKLGYVTSTSATSLAGELTTISEPAALSSHSDFSYTVPSSAPSNTNYRLAIYFTRTNSTDDSWYLDDFSVTYTEPSGGGNADGLTVADQTGTNTTIPVEGVWVDAYQHTQTIYPSNMLTDMQGGQITKLTYYLQSSASDSWGNAKFKVTLGTTTTTEFTSGTGSYLTLTNPTVVYDNGVLDATGSTMVINFTTPYTYTGGNLVVDVQETTTGNYKSATFYGESASTYYSRAAHDSGSIPTQGSGTSFMPKTTFTYESVASVPYTCDFEDTSENGKWAFANDTYTNKWIIGTATSSSSSHAMYVSNNGSANEYTMSSANSYVYAYRRLSFATAGDYNVSFKWKARGESGCWDAMYAALVPDGTACPPSDNITSNTNSLPSGYINVGDVLQSYNTSGVFLWTYNESDWKTSSMTVNIATAGTYTLVFYWKNDGGGGNNPPAAVDDIAVKRAYTIAATASPSAGGTVSGAGTYAEGTSATVTATPSGCYKFVNWTENGTEVSTNETYTFTVSGNRTLVANFEEWTVNPNTANVNTECLTSGTQVVLTAGTNLYYEPGLAGYCFTTGTDASRWYNVTSTTNIMDGGTSTGDYAYSNVKNIGFSFPFAGNEYTQFSVNSDGNLRLGETVTGTSNYSSPFSQSNANSNNPKINGMGFDGYFDVANYGNYVRMQVFGSEPNRVLVVEFKESPYTSNYRQYTWNWQVQLSEDGTIQIVYGPTAPGSYNYSNQIGLCVSASDGWTVSTTTHEATHFTNGTSTTNAAASSWPGINRFYRFTPPPTITYAWTNTGTPGTANGNVYTVSPTQNSTYTVSVTANGCTHTESVNVTVTPAAPGTPVASNITTTTATVSWTGSASSYEYSYDGGTTWTSTNNTSVDLTGLTPGQTYTFQVKTISGSCESTPASVQFTTPSTYNVTATANPTTGGTVSINNGTPGTNVTEACNANSNVTLTATEATGYTFQNWTEGGNVVSSNATYIITNLAAAHTLVANFTANTYNVTYTNGGNGSCAGVATASYGSTVTVTATADTGYELSTLTYTPAGGTAVDITSSMQFTMPAGDVTVNATFTAINYTITYTNDGNGSCSGIATANMGDVVTVTVTPASGYGISTLTYTPAGGTAVDITSSQQFTMPASAVTVHATFTQAVRIITVSVDPAGTGTVSGGGNYLQGASCTVTAQASAGYSFQYWHEYGNPTAVSTDANYTFTVTGDRSLVAHFDPDRTLTTYATPIEGGWVTADVASTIGTITVGTGTSTISNTPYATGSYKSYQQCLYKANEINGSGWITSISYEIKGNTNVQTNHIEIYMKNSSLTSFAGTSNSNFETVTASNKVFDGDWTITNVDGWSTIILDTPFYYDGTSSLMIGIHENTNQNKTANFVYTSVNNTRLNTYGPQNTCPDPNPLDPSTFSASGLTKARGSDRANVRLGFGTYHNGESVALTAHANPGYQFTGWTVDGTADGNTNPYTVTMNANHNVVANFEARWTFVHAGNWDVPTNWLPVGQPGASDDVYIEAAAIIPANCTAEANTVTINSGGTITIAYGGQLIHNNTGVVATVQRNVTAYGAGNAQTRLGYILYTSPVTSAVTNFTGIFAADQNDHEDLYYFDYSHYNNNELKEWVRVTNSASEVIPHVPSGYPADYITGYIYARQNGTTISTPAGTVRPSNSNYNIPLRYTANGTERFNGWNLIGNPFVCNAYMTAYDGNNNELNYYVLNGNGDDFTPASSTNAVSPTGAIMVKATGANQQVVSSRTAPVNRTGILNVDVASRASRGTTGDRARLRFGNGVGLEKFQFDPSHTRVSIPVDGTDYAVVYVEPAGEVPVNFKAEDNGHYTLSFSTEDVNFNYLHLIDNMTGADVDLLADSEENSEAPFAFYSNGVWVINNEGDATLQVIDVLGHVLSSDRISGATTKAINAASGIYMLRLINGDNVKVQKIVVR